MNAAGLFISFEYAPSNLELGTITNKARYDNPTVAKGIGPGMLNPNRTPKDEYSDRRSYSRSYLVPRGD